MNRHGRILVVDDNLQWREDIADTLRHGDFEVETAATREEAIKKIQANLYHLLVLDIRLADEDRDNTEGMRLLNQLKELKLLGAMKIFMLSAFGTMEQMRTAFRDYDVDDFLSKSQFDDQEFLNQVSEIFGSKININLGLKIHWQKPKDPEEVVVNLELDGERIRIGDPMQHRAAFELDDLLCRLFQNAENILIRQLTAGSGRGSVLWLQPFYETGSGRPVIVKFGDFELIEVEYQNFKSYVQPFIGGGRNTSILALRRTPLLGGIVYSMLGSSSDDWHDFASFYNFASIEKIKIVLDDLFQNTCAHWYANPSHMQPINLFDDYRKLLGINSINLNNAFERLRKTVQGKEILYFTSLNKGKGYRNPILAIEGKSLIRPTYLSTTHGDFNPMNIIVDDVGHTWLIDFYRTGVGHILRDIAQLDTVVRFQLLPPEAATLDERLEMEETLNRPSRFSQIGDLIDNFPVRNLELAKAYSTVAYIRQIARRLVAQNPSDDISEYEIPLIFYSLNSIRFHSKLATRQREHALLSACLLAEKLNF